MPIEWFVTTLIDWTFVLMTQTMCWLDSNTTTKTPPQKHFSTTPVLQSTLPVLLRTTKDYTNRLFLSNRASLSLCSWTIAVRNYIRHCGPRPQRHRSLTVKQVNDHILPDDHWILRKSACAEVSPSEESRRQQDFLFLKDLDDILVARYLATQTVPATIDEM